VAFSLAQERVRSPNTCAVKEGLKPAIFISYAAATGPDDDKTKTLLRLHNNTTCNIIVETSDIVPPPSQYSDLFKTQTKTLANGNIETRYISPTRPKVRSFPCTTTNNPTENKDPNRRIIGRVAT
jgi:hypothetical protein